MSASEAILISAIKPMIYSIGNLNDLKNFSNNNFIFSFISIVLLCTFLRIFCIRFQYKIAGKISAKLSSLTFNSITNQKYFYLKSADQSFFISVLIEDIQKTQESIFAFAALSSNLILAVVIMITLIVIEIKLLILSIIFVGIPYFIITKTLSKNLQKAGKKITQGIYLETNIIRSTLSSIADLIINNRLQNQQLKFEESEISVRSNTANIFIYSQSPKFIIECFCLILFAFFILFFNNPNNPLTIIGELGTLAISFNRFLPAAQQIYSGYAAIKSKTPSIDKVIKVLEYDKNDKSIAKNNDSFLRKFNNDETLIPKIKKHNTLRIKNLRFKYPNTNKLIDYKDFEFNSGIPTCIQGRSGCGKSTFLEILLKLHEDYDGEILLNGYPLNKINSSSYRKNITFLPQNSFFFNGTIYENIIFGSKHNSLDNKELNVLGTQLGLKEEFGNNFLEYKISDYGKNISGGQSQRIGILRALSNPSPIILMDEPTSALDRSFSEITTDLIFSKAKSSLIIVVTHDNYLAKKYGKIITL